MTDEFPGASPYRDRHGQERWRYRRKGLSRPLPGDPGASPANEAAYMAAVTGQPTAKVIPLPGAAHPRSLKAAWALVKRSPQRWLHLEASSQAQQTGVAERFLTTRVVEGNPKTYGDMPIDELRRRHINEIIARWSDTPHAAEAILRLIRKLTGAALDEEWIEVDPTYRLTYRPETEGHKAWPLQHLRRFQERWPLGSTPRTVYALGLFQGHRRADIAAIRWADLEAEATSLVQRKTGKPMWIPMLPPLIAALEAAPRRGETVLITGQGKPFSPKGMTVRMRHWCEAAEVPPGYTLHGLRKTLGKLLAEHNATPHHIKAILGHETLAMAELYTKEAEQKILATEGMKLLASLKIG